MKSYNNTDNFQKRLHTIEIVFQTMEYKGTAIMEMKTRGALGYEVINFIDFEDICEDDFKENNVGFRLLGEDDDGNEWFRMILKNDEGGALFVEDELSYLPNYVVKVEIIDCKLI
ncbi:MAG: hypothetical protein JG776_478 [Caloramator sp.]|jgi:hypothetical protein|uniref:Uncharacterized protein n=1 Tax=Caloramator proteoclasticus DSM 10124 TaxID=1121262 RepID=A0A1M4ZGK2_9CLOT|nr:MULTISPECIES: DUF5406 family protein [Caloramator]MBZ4662796.1 hypothetical protein [Caloramator sp.]SHF17088.1 hypothetical protein SAMN02746091_01919 [Caloramator proteoclasticus DSM 10124]